MKRAALPWSRWSFALPWPGARPAAPLLGAIDIGTSRIAVALGIASAQEGIKLIALREQKRQLRSPDMPDDLQEMARALRLALADRPDGDRLADEEAWPPFVVTGTLGRSILQTGEAGADLPDGLVTAAAAARALAAAREVPPETRVLHAFAHGYRVDKGALLPDPRGHRGSHLQASVRLICADENDLTAREESLGRAGIMPDATIAAGLAPALGVLSDAERRQGAIVIDIGALQTRLAVFERGQLVLLDSFGLGGAHVTADLAALWGGNFASAERVKLRQIDVSEAACTDPSTIRIARVNADGRLGGGEIVRGIANRAAAARIEEILEIARDRLTPARGGDAWLPIAALTGGGANLPGIREHAQAILGMAVRIAPPLALAPDGQRLHHGLSGLVGALAWQAGALPDLTRRRERSEASGPNRFSATWDWISATF